MRWRWLTEAAIPFEDLLYARDCGKYSRLLAHLILTSLCSYYYLQFTYGDTGLEVANKVEIPY